MLLHDGRKDVERLAEQLWYPLWNAGIGLDHSVRTPGQAVQVAATDLRAAFGLLEARHIAGDPELSEKVKSAVRQAWRAGIRGRFDEIADGAHERWRKTGDVAHRVEPDLKSGHGGLRDVQLIDALAAAQLVDRPSRDVLDGRDLLLNVRTELHRMADRARDVLRAQDADEVAASLDIADRFELARALSGAARSVAFAAEVGLRQARNALPRRGLAALRRAAGAPTARQRRRRARRARSSWLATPPPPAIPRWCCASPRPRHARASRWRRAPCTGSPTPRPSCASRGRARRWGSCCRCSAPGVRSWTSWSRWTAPACGGGCSRSGAPCATCRRGTARTSGPSTGTSSRPARTAARLTTQVARPDLLLVGTLLHDIGKGRGGDHSVVGESLAVQIGRRLGFAEPDVAVLGAVVRHHLLLPHTATRRDLEDQATVVRVVETLEQAVPGGGALLLDLLGALAEADSLATGPGVWSPWKRVLIGDLVARCRALLAGEALPAPAEPSAAEIEHGRRGGGGGTAPAALGAGRPGDRHRRPPEEPDRRARGGRGRARAAFAGGARGRGAALGRGVPRRDRVPLHGDAPLRRLSRPGAAAVGPRARAGREPRPRRGARTQGARLRPRGVGRRTARSGRGCSGSTTRPPARSSWSCAAPTGSGCCTGSRPRWPGATSGCAGRGSPRSGRRSWTRSASTPATAPSRRTSGRRWSKPYWPRPGETASSHVMSSAEMNRSGIATRPNPAPVHLDP